jgi:hypothetical protein
MNGPLLLRVRVLSRAIAIRLMDAHSYVFPTEIYFNPLDFSAALNRESGATERDNAEAASLKRALSAGMQFLLFIFLLLHSCIVQTLIQPLDTAPWKRDSLHVLRIAFKLYFVKMCKSMACSILRSCCKLQKRRLG